MFSKHIELKIFNSFGEEVSAAWARLEASGYYYVFQRFNWLKHWQQTIGEATRIDPIIVVVFEHKEPILLFPLCLERIFGIRVIKFLGGDQADYNAPMMLPSRISSDAFMEIWNQILELLPAHDVRYFTRIPARLGGVNNPFLFGVTDNTTDGVAYSTNLVKSWIDFEQHISKKLLKDNARMSRRLSDVGHVEILDATSPVQYQKIIETTILQKTRRYLETGVRNILSDASVRKFYTDLYAAMQGDPKVHLTALKVGDQILATHLGVYDRGRYYYLFPTHDGGALSKYSPGRLLLEYLIKSAIKNELNIFDFTVGGEAYKQRWCDSEMRLYRILEANTRRGILYVWLQRLILWAKHSQYARFVLVKGISFFRKFFRRHEK